MRNTYIKYCDTNPAIEYNYVLLFYLNFIRLTNQILVEPLIPLVFYDHLFRNVIIRHGHNTTCPWCRNKVGNFGVEQI